MNQLGLLAPRLTSRLVPACRRSCVHPASLAQWKVRVPAKNQKWRAGSSAAHHPVAVLLTATVARPLRKVPAVAIAPQLQCTSGQAVRQGSNWYCSTFLQCTGSQKPQKAVCSTGCPGSKSPNVHCAMWTARTVWEWQCCNVASGAAAHLQSCHVLVMYCRACKYCDCKSSSRVQARRSSNRPTECHSRSIE
jgi:hypothetical protein